MPVSRSTIPLDVIAGVTLATLAIPEVMGYTSIAGMPVITGLYTILVPLLAFALLGSSRHLVVGADSATAAVLAAGLAGLATAQSSECGAFGSSERPPEWICIYAAAIADIDISGGESLETIVAKLHAMGVTLVLAEVMPEVRTELDLYEITELIGAEHIFPTIAAAERAFRARAIA